MLKKTSTRPLSFCRCRKSQVRLGSSLLKPRPLEPRLLVPTNRLCKAQVLRVSRPRACAQAPEQPQLSRRTPVRLDGPTGRFVRQLFEPWLYQMDELETICYCQQP